MFAAKGTVKCPTHLTSEMPYKAGICGSHGSITSCYHVTEQSGFVADKFRTRHIHKATAVATSDRVVATRRCVSPWLLLEPLMLLVTAAAVADTDGGMLLQHACIPLSSYWDSKDAAACESGHC
jgi:hypothetical protein